jgi:hypothetical protein
MRLGVATKVIADFVQSVAKIIARNTKKPLTFEGLFI